MQERNPRTRTHTDEYEYEYEYGVCHVAYNVVRGVEWVPESPKFLKTFSSPWMRLMHAIITVRGRKEARCASECVMMMHAVNARVNAQ